MPCLAGCHPFSCVGPAEPAYPYAGSRPNELALSVTQADFIFVGELTSLENAWYPPSGFLAFYQGMTFRVLTELRGKSPISIVVVRRAIMSGGLDDICQTPNGSWASPALVDTI